jgi:hypothetical protein
MRTKLFAACLAIAAFAALPSMASAATLTENGVDVPVGAKVLATNSESIVLTSSIGNITCTKSTLTGDVTQNSGGVVKATITTASFTGTGTGGACTSTIIFNPQFVVDVENLHYCLETPSGADTFTVRGGGCSEAARNTKFTLTNSVIGNCTYEKASVAGTFTTNVTPAPLKFENQEFTKSAGGSACPGSGKLKGAYTLETEESPNTGLSIS